MDDLFYALQRNGFAKRDDVTLEYVIANTAQDAQYSPGARESLAVLMKYEEYKDVKLSVLKAKFLMKDCSD
jgi:hypothetical protein